MIILLSPAKKMNITHAHTGKASQPLFIEQAEAINDELLSWNEEQVQKVMATSATLTESTMNLIGNWSTEHTRDNSTEALLAFTGHVFEYMNPKGFTKKELNFAEKSVRILSGFYGMLRPHDLIRPYRFELGFKTQLLGQKNPYHYWKPIITQQLAHDMSKKKHIINLASDEYSKVIDFSQIDAEVVTPVFLENKNGTLKTLSVYAKAARGLMTRFIVQNGITTPAALTDFTAEGYAFNAELSVDGKMVFVR